MRTKSIKDCANPVWVRVPQVLLENSSILAQVFLLYVKFKLVS